MEELALEIVNVTPMFPMRPAVLECRVTFDAMQPKGMTPKVVPWAIDERGNEIPAVFYKYCRGRKARMILVFED